MPGPFDAVTAKDPTKYGALSMGGRQFTGLWTQRSPYRDADVPYLVGKFYSATRFDSIWDGRNREISAKLIDRRRPGSPIFNASSFGAVLGFYSFKYIQNGVEVVRIMVDTATAVYDATPASVGGTGKTLIFTKSAGAGATRFLGIGATLYMSNGVDNVKWIRSGSIWQASTNYTQGQYIVDTNNNLQLNIGSQQATLTDIQVQGNVCTVFFSAATQLDIPDGVELTFDTLTIPAATALAMALSNTTQTVTAIENGQQLQFAFTFGNTAFTAVTAGTVTTGNGTSGTTQPAWATGLNAITQDAGAQWENRGSAVQQWMYNAPPNAPTVTQATAPSLYPAWAASTWYAPLFVIVDSNGNLQQLTTAGTTGASAPTWATVKGATTNDGTGGTMAVWTCLGSAAWQASFAYSVGDVVKVTFTYYITVPQVTYKEVNGYFIQEITYIQQQVSATCIFQCTVAGTSGSTAPSWVNGTGTVVTESTGVSWINQGSSVSNEWPGATQKMSLATQVLDSNNNIQTAQYFGESGTSHPTWGTALGSYTVDDNGTPATPQSWVNAGPYSSANTGAWIYAFSGLNSITGDITTASPLSNPITQGAGNLIVVQGQGVQRTFDQIILWRTVQNGSLLLYDSQIPNPGPTSTWIFTDTTPDTGLNAEFPAPIASSNNAPPAGMTAPVYHLQRVWAIVNNQVVYSGGPDVLSGNGNDAFPPLNAISYPAKCIRLLPVTVSNGGLLVWTTSGVWVILGTGTNSNPFYTTLYEPSVGILGYTAMDVLGATPYFMENNGKVSSFDPQNGYTEVGFPIGDQFENVTTGGSGVPQGQLYNPATAYVTWNIQSSGETAMYVSDGAVGWFRFSPIAPPESGSLWSPRAVIQGGTSAVQSVETSPGIFNLLIGPASNGPIRMRDTTGTVWQDWTGTAGSGSYESYPAWDAKGVTILCSTGQVAEIAWIATKSTLTGARPTIGLLMNEIMPTNTVPYDTLQWTSPDPADLARSQTVYSDRYSALQSGVTPKGDCALIKFDYGTQAAGDELLEFAIFGATREEITR